MVPVAPTIAALLGLLTLSQTATGAALVQVHPHAVLPARQSAAPACTAGTSIPKLYTFGDLRVTYPASDNILGAQSTASFTITNTKTNTSEALACNLRGSYTCQFNGTPKNPKLEVWLQLNLFALFSFRDATPCDGNLSITGGAEMPFTCPNTPIELGQTCVGDVPAVEASGYVDVTVP
ncbi:hypothetical protein B0T16DRAFT_410665 [Cercophora newfieldiana]|uniref:AA1-like domain-containing protein n=1 Tax=Cercophora newfieldiana TaxID=92897 RepID=A0AA39YBU3_9PEZI|nr:hypothetical protein B0T16DRAFT_410665 [Cercophora newfieldiana]